MKSISSYDRFLCITSLCASFASAQLQTGLVSYLEFEVDASNNALASGDGGSLEEGATASAAGGLVGNALLLSSASANQHVSLPVAYGPGTDLEQDFTISAWYNLNDNPAANGSSRYFVFESDVNFQVSYGLRDSGVGEPGINDGQVFTGNGGSVVIADAGLSGWQHVIQTFATEGETVTIRTFINGEEVPTLTTGSGDFAATGFNIGAARNVATDRGFDGLIDEVALWNRPLSEAEVYEVYRRGETGQSVVSAAVPDPAPQIVSFSSSPASIEKGGEVMLSWEVTGATSVWISDLGVVDTQATETLVVNDGLNFVLVALNGNSVSTSELTVEATDPPADLRSELVAYYRLDTDLSNDAAASGPDAAGVNDPTVGAAGGAVGNSLELSTATNQHVTAPISFGGQASDLGESFTISAWYQLNEPVTANGSGRYFVFEAAENFDVSFGLRDSGLGEPGINDGQSFSEGGSLGFADAALAGWHQVVQRYDSRDGVTTIETFIDGVSGGAFQVPAANISGTGINFGAPRSSVVDRGFDGRIDEVAIWSRSLTDEEVALTFDLGDAGVGLTGSVAPPAIRSSASDPVSGIATLQFSSSIGETYAVERSFDLIIWNEIEDNLQATSEVTSFQDGGAGSTAFYRVRRLN